MNITNQVQVSTPYAVVWQMLINNQSSMWFGYAAKHYNQPSSSLADTASQHNHLNKGGSFLSLMLNEGIKAIIMANPNPQQQETSI